MSFTNDRVNTRPVGGFASLFEEPFRVLPRPGPLSDESQSLSALSLTKREETAAYALAMTVSA